MRLLPLDGAGDVARRMAPILVFLVALLGTLTTVLLALDTTAVLSHRSSCSLAAQLNLPPMPFALLTVWLANTASLLLPVLTPATCWPCTNLGSAPGLLRRGCGCRCWLRSR